MLLLIDNYDSFTYNLVHYLGEIGQEVTVRRNDAIDVQEALELKPEGIILSPAKVSTEYPNLFLSSLPYPLSITSCFLFSSTNSSSTILPSVM